MRRSKKGAHVLDAGNAIHSDWPSFSGSAAAGVGSPHTPAGYVWPIALAMQGLTATDDAEKLEMLRLLETTDAGTLWMHESFNANDPRRFTRP